MSRGRHAPHHGRNLLARQQRSRVARQPIRSRSASAIGRGTQLADRPSGIYVVATTSSLTPATGNTFAGGAVRLAIHYLTIGRQPSVMAPRCASSSSLFALRPGPPLNTPRPPLGAPAPLQLDGVDRRVDAVIAGDWVTRATDQSWTVPVRPSLIVATAGSNSTAVAPAVVYLSFGPPPS